MSTGYWVGAVQWDEFLKELESRELGNPDGKFCRVLWDADLAYDIEFPFDNASGCGQDGVTGYIELRSTMPKAKALLLDQFIGSLLSDYMNKPLSSPDFSPEAINTFDIANGRQYMTGLTAMLNPPSVANLADIWNQVDIGKLRSIARSNWEEKDQFEYGDDFVDYLEAWGAFVEQAQTDGAGIVIYHV